jgi:hypothetical protein
MNTTLKNNNANQTEACHTATACLDKNVSSQLDQVKHEVFAEYQHALGANEQLLRLAIIEAETLARQTEYPHLVFPLLASEKAHNAARWQFHQKYLLRSNSPYALAA